METENKTEPDDAAFRAALDLKIAEQNYYWSRFTAFSALDAALIVFYGSTVQAFETEIAGLLLSLFWLFVQRRSHEVNSKLDAPFRAAKKRFLLDVEGTDPAWTSGFGELTWICLALPLCLAIFWAIALCLFW